MGLSSSKPGYQPLSKSDKLEIRVVKLFPGNFDDEIRCELEYIVLDTTSTDENPEIPYTALSYTWGDPTKTAPIQLNGEAHPVTLNLESFLRHMQTLLYHINHALPTVNPLIKPAAFRHMIVHKLLQDISFPRDFPSTPPSQMKKWVQSQSFWVPFKGDMNFWKTDGGFHRLWIDSLCINQQDMQERNRQVARMADIYKFAENVMIWPESVSNPIPNIEGAFKLMYEAEKAGPSSEKLGRDAFLKQFASRWVAQEGSADVNTLEKIYSCDWFSRA